VEAHEGLVVLGSEELIETAVEAVLDNAIGFTPAGGRVELRLHRNGTRAEIRISDDGPGVSPEHRERIFERGFSLRPETAAAGGEDHGGIGLWMARRYLQALGGRIRAENRVGRGLMIRLELPLLGSA
jgi:two-component system sensor histidine kinase ChvG